MGTRPARASHQRSPAAWLTLALLGAAGLGNASGLIISIALLLEPGEIQLLFGTSVSDWFWGLSALLFAALTVVCGYVLRAAWNRDPGAGLAVSVLALIGIGYSLLSITHGYGWAVLIVSLGLLVANQLATAQGYYSGHALSLRRN